MPRPVCGRLLLHQVDILPPRNIYVDKFGERTQPLHFGAGLEHHAAKIEIVDAVSQPKTEIVGRSRQSSGAFVQARIGGHRAVHQIVRNRLRLFIVEIIHRAAQVIFVVVERHKLKAPMPASDHVEAAVRITFDDRFHRDRTSGIGQTALLATDDGANNAEFRPLGFRLADHLAIALFENVQGCGAPRKDDQLEREEREQARHSFIIGAGCVKLPTRVRSRLLMVFLSVACGVFAQDATRLRFDCIQEELIAAGMTCSDSDPCPVYLELSAISASGASGKLAVAGNFHGPSATLASLLFFSGDGGKTWKEQLPHAPGAALDQVQLFDATHSWAAGEVQIPLARDPFILITTDGGATWRRKQITEEGGPGYVQRFWFDSADHGELIVDAGRSAEGGRYHLYETHTGGDSWTIVSQTAQPPRLRRAPAVENIDYRIGTDSRTHAYIVEKRDGEKWTRIASFPVQIAACGSPPPPPEPEPPAPEVRQDAK